MTSTLNPRFLKSFGSSAKALMLAVIMMVGVNNAFGASTFYSILGTSGTPGSWTAGATWSSASCAGGGGSVFPSSTDPANICTGKYVTTAVTSTCADLSVIGTLKIPTGTTLTVNGNLTGTGTIDMTGSGTLIVTGNFAFTGTFTQGTGTVTLLGSSAQTITGGYTFYNLTSSGSADKSMLGNMTVTNSLKLLAGNLIVGANTLTLSATVTQSGTGGMTIATGTSLVINGSLTLANLKTSLFLTNSYPLTFANLTMSSSGTLAIGGNVNVTGTYTQTSGSFYQNNLGAFNLTVGSYLQSAERITKHITAPMLEALLPLEVLSNLAGRISKTIIILEHSPSTAIFPKPMLPHFIKQILLVQLVLI